MQSVAKSLPDEVKCVQRASPTQGVASTSSRKEEGKFVDLPGAEEGKVVVRFPPEASGLFILHCIHLRHISFKFYLI